MDRWPRALCVIVFVLAGREVNSAAPSVSEIVAGLERAEALLFESESFFIRYERTRSVDVIPTVASGGYLPAEWILAYRGDMWRLDRRFTLPGGTGEADDPLIPSEPSIHVIRDQVLFDWEGEGDEAKVNTFGNGRNIFAGLYYTRHLSMDAPKHIIKAAGEIERLAQLRKRHADDLDHPFLPDFLKRNASHYRVAPEPVEVEDRQCWLVEWPGMDRIWIDVERGFAIPRRVYHWGPGKPERFEYLNSDYREVKHGLWLPFRQIELRYASIVAERESLWGKVACRSEFQVHELVFDRLPATFFKPDLPQGTFVADYIRGFRYVVADGSADPFSGSLEDGKMLLKRIEDTPPGRVWVNISLGILTWLLVVVALWLIRRSKAAV